MAQEPPVNFKVDPDKTPVYFVDGCLIASNQQSLTLSFSQAVFAGKEHNVISRMAMTMTQAKNFLKDLNDHIEKNER